MKKSAVILLSIAFAFSCSEEKSHTEKIMDIEKINLSFNSLLNSVQDNRSRELIIREVTSYYLKNHGLKLTIESPDDANNSSRVATSCLGKYGWTEGTHVVRSEIVYEANGDWCGAFIWSDGLSHLDCFNSNNEYIGTYCYM